MGLRFSKLGKGTMVDFFVLRSSYGDGAWILQLKEGGGGVSQAQE